MRYVIVFITIIVLAITIWHVNTKPAIEAKNIPVTKNWDDWIPIMLPEPPIIIPGPPTQPFLLEIKYGQIVKDLPQLK